MQYATNGTYNRTNQFSSYLFSNALKMNIKKSDLRSNFSASWLYGRQQDILVNNDVSGTFDLNLYRYSPRFYYWALLNYISSYSLKVNHQAQGGLGVAYHFIETNNFQLNVSDGLLYDYASLAVADTLNDIYQTPRNSLRVQVKAWLGDRITFIAIGFLQNSLQRADDYIVKSESSLQIRLKKWISVNARFTYNQFSRTRKENLFITYGIILEHRF